jgi:phosphocarrier protein HPr
MEIKTRILNDEGLHARPAGILVKAANGFQSKIDLSYNGKTVNGKSLLSIMSLGLTKDAEFAIKAEGSDAERAVEALKLLVENKFQV